MECDRQATSTRLRSSSSSAAGRSICLSPPASLRRVSTFSHAIWYVLFLAGPYLWHPHFITLNSFSGHSLFSFTYVNSIHTIAWASPTHQRRIRRDGNERYRHSFLQCIISSAHLLEDDAVHHTSISNARASEAQIEAACQADDTPYGESDDTENTCPPSEDILRVFQSGAKITANMAVELLHLYTSKLAHNQYMPRQPEFAFRQVSDSPIMYECRVRLPSDAALRELRGPACLSKKEAKRQVALEACRQLHNIGALNECLLPANHAHDTPAPPARSDAQAGPSVYQPPTVKSFHLH